MESSASKPPPFHPNTMTRCLKCSECAIPQLADYQDGQEYVLRTWQDWKEIVTLADKGCDFCLLIRHHLHNRQLRSWQLDVIRPGGIKIQLSSPRADEYHIQTEKSPLIQISGWRRRPENRFFDRDTALDKDWISQAQMLLEECQSEHGSCNVVSHGSDTKIDSSYPRRLLDVSDPSTIRIIDTEYWISQGLISRNNISYCTLSYRWPSEVLPGSILEKPFTNFIELNFDAMPQTFQDAITIARGLKFPFLWIDALCIVQPSAVGNSSDWHVEGPRMGVIYNNAVFTIAATSVYYNGDGFLAQVGIERLSASPCVFPVKGTDEDTACIDVARPSLSSVTRSSLNKRGWVTQERFLSRRILHFTTSGVFWECLEASKHGTYGSVSSDEYLQAMRNPQNLGIGERWRDFVSRYSSCEFTNRADRLVALSSITKVVQATFLGEQYCAGAWGASILDDLLWIVTSSVSTKNNLLHIAPSWSWASTSSSIAFYPKTIQVSLEDMIPVARVLDISIRPSFPSNPYGNVDEGTLTIKGIVISYERLQRRSATGLGRLTSLLDVMPRSSLETNEPGPQRPTQHNGKILLLQARATGSVVEYFGLIIKPVKTDHGTTDQSLRRCRRLGLVVYHDDCESTGSIEPSIYTVAGIFGKGLSVIELV